MDCTFEERKEQLESECVVRMTQFSRCLDRLSDFMGPFVKSLPWQRHCDYAEKFVAGLCSDLARKNAESIAYHFELERKTIQHFVGESEWSDTPLRAELASQIGSPLGEVDGVLIFDPSSFVKSGKESVVSLVNGAGGWGRLITVKWASIWVMPAAKDTHWWTASYTCPRSGRVIRNA